ncbi:MAG: rhodanese [Desulfobulbaceae bacterium]|uniref:Rhodanese n=1 Tax=Candidatus Desulfobia pelagia TaxID=2841692 RepID=A0A8J6NEW3_9BACT|nr:rhodanese [Candidatus Desulfobia pelagia]
MSPESAGLAVKAGYTNVKVYLKGVPAWKKSGRNVVASTKHVKDGNIVLVDLRPTSEYKQGHIPRAYSVPLEDMEDLEDDLPASMAAPVVLYGTGDDKAYKFVKKLGYKTTSIYQGGVDAWVASGNQLSTDAAPEEITWKRILGKGEVTVAAFNKVADGEAPGGVILDVRTKDEAAEGMFDNAIHVPLDELQAKMNEIPKDKEVMIHCSTGARAEMAYKELKAAGFNAYYLVADVECDEDGCETAEE